jgi:hypothetical protein
MYSNLFLKWPNNYPKDSTILLIQNDYFTLSNNYVQLTLVILPPFGATGIFAISKVTNIKGEKYTYRIYYMIFD